MGGVASFTDCGVLHRLPVCMRGCASRPLGVRIPRTVAITPPRTRENHAPWELSRQWQPQALPQPPPARGVDIAEARSLPDTLEPCLPPTEAKTESNLTVSSWPSGHWAGKFDALIERRSSNTVSQVRQRNS